MATGKKEILDYVKTRDVDVHTTRILRTDNMCFNPEIVNQVIRKGTAK